MPGLFDFEDHDRGAARAGTVELFDAVGMLGNLWRRMQVRRWCGQDQPFVRFGFSFYQFGRKLSMLFPQLPCVSVVSANLVGTMKVSQDTES
jgi:hypothetical protein